MLVELKATWPPRHRGKVSVFETPRTETIVKDFPDSPFQKSRGFMAAIAWAQGRFPGAQIQLRIVKAEVKA